MNNHVLGFRGDCPSVADCSAHQWQRAYTKNMDNSGIQQVERKPLEMNDAKKRSVPKCAKCKNHGLDNELKGHKRFCRYVSCLCECCKISDWNRRVMANQVRLYRELIQDDIIKKKGLSLQPVKVEKELSQNARRIGAELSVPAAMVEALLWVNQDEELVKKRIQEDKISFP